MAASSSGGVMTQMPEQVSYRPAYYNNNIYRGANEAPGWRRVIANGDVIYISPTGIAMRSINHVKDYLLSAGTCKCGLPCPLQPEIFFDFNSEVPTQLLQSPKTSSCLHHINSIKKSSEWNMSNISNAASSRLATNSPLAHNELHKNSPSPVYSQQSVESAPSSPQPPQSNRCETKIGNMNLSKTPPWRKNSILNQQNASTVTNMAQMQTERPSPQHVLNNSIEPPTARYIHTSTQPPWHEETQKRLLKTRLAAAANNQKKRPNFKDDPTGYLEQQTALLQSSILNVVQNSPLDAQESLHTAAKSLDNSSKPASDQQMAKRHDSLTNSQSHHQLTLPYNSGGNYPASGGHEDSQFVYLQRNNCVDTRKPLESPQGQHQLQGTTLQTSYDSGHLPTANKEQPQEQQHQSKYQAHFQTSKPDQQQQQRIAIIPSNRRINVQCVNPNQIGSDQAKSQPQARSIFITPANTHQFTATIKKGGEQVLVVNHRPNIQQNADNNITEVDGHYTFNRKKIKMLMPSASEASSVSSSTTYCDGQPELNGRPPAQVGAISTSNLQLSTSSSNSSSHSESSSSSSVYMPRAMTLNASKLPPGSYALGQLTSAKNTITSVLAGNSKGRALTATSTSSYDGANGKKSIIKSIAKISKNKIQTMDAANAAASGGQKPTYLDQEPVEQTVLMPFDQHGKPHLKPIKTTVRRMPQAMASGIQYQTMNANNNPASHQPNHQNSQFLINANGQIIVMPNSSVKASNHQLMQSNNSVVLNSNPVHVIQSQQPQNVLLNNANMANASNKLISMGTGIGQQTVLLNALPANSYVLQQPTYATSVDGQVLQIQSANNQQNAGQQHNIQLVTTHDDGKQRQNDAGAATNNVANKARKRKSESLSPQSPQSVPLTSMLQITASPQYHHQSPQGFHISPGVSGIALSMNKGAPQANATNTGAAQQQIILQQNGQTILQPVNLIGQQLLVPAGHLMMTPDAASTSQTTTLLQIQNVTPCGNLLAPQQMMYHHRQSPHNKTTFLTPAASPGATGGGQQYIVNGNGQISPIGQVYSAPMSLLVPQQTTGAANATFVQQQQSQPNQTQQLMQQQHHHLSHAILENNNPAGQQRHQNSISPPDTTTHSPRIPERPPSEISGSSGDVNMVQLVSSSEPDSAFSPALTDGEQSTQSIGDLSHSNKLMGRRNQTPSPEKVLTNRVAVVSAAIRDAPRRK